MSVHFLTGRGLDNLFLAKLLVTIPSYVYILDGYNQGVGEGASQNGYRSTHI